MKKDKPTATNVDLNIARISLIVALVVLLVGDNLLGRWFEHQHIKEIASEKETSSVEESVKEAVPIETTVEKENFINDSTNNIVQPVEKFNHDLNDIVIHSEEIQESTENLSNNMEPLVLEIVSYEYVDNFHYEYLLEEDSNECIVIDFENGLSGTFKYSRDLTEGEKIDWGHGGYLYDAEGRNIGGEEDYPVFWSMPEGKFAVQFPKNMHSGVYIYELYHVINGRTISDTINFEIG